MRRPSNDIRTAEEQKRLMDKLKIAEKHKPRQFSSRQEKVIR